MSENNRADIWAIIQARMGSTRLPGKVLMDLCGKSVLERVVERVLKSQLINGVMIATSNSNKDAEIVKECKRIGAKFFCGSEEDVLDRYYKAAKTFDVGHIIRITADCPLLDPEIIDRVVNRYFESKADYCSNILKETFPDGMDVEVFNFDVLSEAWENANLLSEREHVTPYIRNHPDMFKLVNLSNDENIADKRWTVDERKDLDFIRAITEGLICKKPNFTMQDILDFLKDNPQTEELNKEIKRNEGYFKSLKKDRKSKNVEK